MKKANILIVDDKKANVYSLRELLLSDEYNILEAYSGEECLSILLQNTIDLVLLDIQMPNMDGFETLTYIRENPKTSQIPVIFITATVKTEAFHMKGYERGAIDIVYKPVDEVILKSKVQQFLQMANDRIALQEKIEMLETLNEENQKMRSEIEQLAFTDYLTGLHNRRHIDSEYVKLYRHCYRHQSPLAVIMIDLDNFKGYNDYYGHLKGDEVLKQVSNCITSNINRSLDTVGRYGGEEFLIILPDTTKEGAFTIAENIRNCLLDEKILHCPNCYFEFVTISLGVACDIPRDYHVVSKLVEKSDQALYQAKRMGKNCTIIYNEKENSN